MQRVFDFLGLERADISLKAYEEATVKMFVAAPPPPFPPLGLGVTIGIKHTSAAAKGESGVAAEWRAQYGTLLVQTQGVAARPPRALPPQPYLGRRPPPRRGVSGGAVICCGQGGRAGAARG